MANCVNKKHPEVKKLAESFNLPVDDAAAVVSVWQDENNTYDRFPTENEFSEELDIIIDKTDEIYDKSIQASQVPLSKKFKNRPKYNTKVLAPGSKPQLIEKDGKKIYPEGYEKGTNKRHILNKFFRYDGDLNHPYYPYRASLQWSENKKYIDYINSHYDNGVVGVENDGSIIFRPNVNEANYIGSYEVLDMPYNPSKKITEEKKPDTSHIDTAIDDIQKRKKLLEIRISKTGGTAKMRANITKLQAQLDTLIEERKTLSTPDILEKIAESDAKFLEANLQTISENVDNIAKKSDKQILELTQNLIDNSYNIKGWIGIIDFIGRNNKEMISNFDESSISYKRLNDKYEELAGELFTEYANRNSSFNKLSKSEILAPVKDINLYQAGTSTIGDNDIKLLQIVDDIIKNTAFKINEESIKKRKEVDAWVEKLEKAGFKKEDVFEIFKQKYKDNWTGNIVGSIKHEYYIKKQEKLKESIAKNNPRIYTKWVKDNSAQIGHKTLKDVLSGKYNEAEELGYSKEELDIQKELLEKYQSDKDAYLEFVEFKYANNKSAMDEEMLFWEKENSPYLTAQGEMNSGYKYLIQEKPNIEKWSDKKFDKIKNTPVLNEFYQFIRQRFDENNKELGYFNEYDEFYLPEEQASFLERIKAQENMKKAMSYVKNSMIEVITEEVEFEHSGVDIAGKKIKSVKISMMQDKISPHLKESNIFEVLNDHTEMTLNYKYKTQIEPMVNAATDLLDRVKEIKPGDKTIDNGLVNAKKQLEYAKDANLYGERKDTEGRIKKIKTKEQILNKETGKIEEVEVEREITASALGDTLITYTYLKAMSIPNLVTPAVNMLFGINANLVYAAAGEDIDLKNARKAMLQMTAITAKSFGGKTNGELAKKVFAFMEQFEILGTIHDSDYGNKKSVSEIITILQSKAEYFNQGSLMLGMLYTQKLKDKNGKEVSIFDAYKLEDGMLTWNTELMGKQSETSSDRVISEDKRGVNFVNLGKYIDEVNGIVHGDYKSSMMAKKSVWLRTLLLFKTWIFKAIDHRFATQRTDMNLMKADGTLGRDVKGRYKSYLKSTTKEGIDLTFKDTMGILIKGLVSKKAFNELSDVDRVNLMRNLKELQQIATFYLMALLAKGLLMDDDDDAKPILNLAINTLTKTGADLTFFLSPNSASQVLDNLVPVANTLRDLQRVTGSAFNLLQGDIMYESGPWRGNPKLAINTMRIIPGSAGAIKMFNYGDRVFEY